MSIVMRKKFSSKTKTYKQTLMSFKKLFFGEDILAHLSQRLKRAFLITICLFSVVVVLVVVVVVNFAHFHLLLQSHWTNINQTWHKGSLGDMNSSLFKWRAPPFSNGRYFRNSEKTLMKFKNLLLTKPGTKRFWVKGILKVCSNEGPRPFSRRR